MLNRIPGARSFERMVVLIVSALLLAGCGGASDSTPEGTFEAPVVAFGLVFEDEFDGTSLDTAKWNIQTGDGCPDLCGWGNNELQQYSEDAIDVSGGTLKIVANQEMGGGFTSARINTKDKFEFRYGRVEFSARLPAGQGMWPALWMFHADPDIYGPWPASGEIDVMEAFNPGVMGNTATQSTLHYGLPGAPFTGTSSQNDNMMPLDAGFHEYAVEWERDQMRFFVDGVHFQTQTSDEWYTYFPADEDGFYDPLGAYKVGPRDAPFDQAFYLIMNLAVGGNPVGPPEGTSFPQTFEIDYVRVFQCENANPDTGRGCGTGDRTIEPLEDNDGGPLEDVPTDNPFVERLDLFVDGPEAITISTPDGDATNQIGIDGFTGDGATVVSDPAFADPDDPTNTVWRVAISGATSNVFLTSQVFEDDPFLETGFDFSGGRVPGEGTDPFGEVAFEMEVVSIDPGATILIKLDSGFPNLGEFAIPADALAAPGTRKTYSVKFQEFLDNPGFVDCCGGAGVDLANVRNPFVLEVAGGSAEVYLDNIYVTNACKVIGGCGADLKTAGLPDLVVFDDEVNTDVFDRGLVGSDSGSGFTDYTDGTNAANKVNFAVVAADDAARGDVVEVTFNDSDAFGVFFFGSSTGVDVSAYGAGAIVFDLLVTDYGSNTTGMTMKIDCFFPCSSGDQALGVVADGVWETITVPLASLPALDQTSVNTGLVIFPTTQAGGITFRLDNVRFEAETAEPPPTFADLPVTFDDVAVTYTPVDFGGASTVIGPDPDDANNNVAVTTKTNGAEVFAGTVITDPTFPTAIPFAAGETLMSMRVRTPLANTPVLLKIETADASVFAEVTVNTTAADTWETLTFDFSTVAFDAAAAYERAIVFFDFGTMGDDAVYRWDDVAFGGAAPPPPPAAVFDLPVTFDDDTVTYNVIDFGGAGTAVGVADPQDARNTVAQTTKGAGAETFAGTVIGDGSGFTNGIPIAVGETTMSVRVLSPTAGIPVRLKIENADGSLFSELDVNTTVAGEWERLVFDFSDVAIDTSVAYVQAVIFFDFGAVGDDSVYHWDDLRFGVPQELPFTFDIPQVSYGFGDFAGAATVLAVDPDDAGNMVASTTKTVGAEFFAGTVVGGFDIQYASVIPFSAGSTTMSVRVRAPAAGIPVRLKVENADASVTAEINAVTTVADAWETLTFDLSDAATAPGPIDVTQEYVRAVIFFNFVDGVAGDGAVYLWDDLQF